MEFLTSLNRIGLKKEFFEWKLGVRRLYICYRVFNGEKWPLYYM